MSSNNKIVSFGFYDVEGPEISDFESILLQDLMTLLLVGVFFICFIFIGVAGYYRLRKNQTEREESVNNEKHKASTHKPFYY